ncbi:SAM-dependent methyltransferase [Micromonospora cathayae]|uniref:S-adenosyl-L-methionine-dependent methyltransferase n=1 Tax=Micromonospora cathayae TaxID=3028804 RepID=A0ABY7ZJF4_9ACTN|nr:SAM-dependent methyltransferase [Micromonospora sp. HUAS 3]WDZ83122.1 SAM-dependent methyltransferase [Micromonospora sp. HUAS 3]
MDGFDAVARTALLTAALRAQETARPDRLYADPYAVKLAAELGPDLFGTVDTVSGEKRAEPAPERPLPNTTDYNAIRTRFLDDFLLTAVADSGPTQIVIGAAGMDTRAYRLPWPTQVEIFEVDRPQVLAFKDAVLGDEALPAGVTRRTVGADLLVPGWTDALVAAGYDPTRASVWLLEGLLYYLPERQARELLATVAASTAPGSRVACDMVNAQALRSPVMRPLLAVFEAWGSPWLFGSDTPELLFAEYGIDAVAVQPGEPGADYGGRWRDPVPPRDLVPDVERVFCVHGRRV